MRSPWKLYIAAFSTLCLLVSVIVWYQAQQHAEPEKRSLRAHEKGFFLENGKMLKIVGPNIAIPLKNRKILFLGHDCSGNMSCTIDSQPLAPKPLIAEVYDPKSNKFSLLSLNNRSFKKLLLADGRYLNLSNNRVKLRIPKTNKLFDFDLSKHRIWGVKKNLLAPQIPIPTGMGQHYKGYEQATRLKNGKILLTSGWVTLFSGDNALPYGCNDYKEGAEIFDPKTNAFTKTGRLVYARREHSSTLLPDGRVLITGGIDMDSCDSGDYFDSPTDSVEIYTP